MQLSESGLRSTASALVEIWVVDGLSAERQQLLRERADSDVGGQWVCSFTRRLASE